MQRLFGKLVIFLILMLMGLYAAEHVFKHQTRFETTMDIFTKAEEKPNLLFIGSSHAYCAYDTRVFEAELGVGAINFGSSSQRLESTDVIIDHLLKSYTPDLLVIDIFSNSLDGYPVPAQIDFQLNMLDNIPLSAKKLEVIDSSFGRKNLIHSLSTTYRNHNRWNKISSTSFTRTLKTDFREDYHNGFVTSLTTFSDSIENLYRDRFSKNVFYAKELPAAWKYTIDQVLANLDALGVDYMFINSPSLLGDIDSVYKGYSALLKEYFESKNVRFLDLNLINDSLQLRKKHYRDPNHLNQKGALLVSKYLSAYFKEHYELSSQTARKDHLNRYKHIKEDFKNVTFFRNTNIKLDSTTISSAALYRVMGQKIEVLMELDNATITEIPFRFEYKINKGVLGKLPAVLRPKGSKKVFSRTLTENDIIQYNGKVYAICSLPYPSDFIEELVLFVGNENKRVITIINNKLAENIYDQQQMVSQQKINKRLTDRVTLASLEVLKKRESSVLKFTFKESLAALTTEYNIGVHVFPTKESIENGFFVKENSKAFISADIPLVLVNDTLKVEIKTAVENIEKAKIFLYDRAGYKGVVGAIVWLERSAFEK